MGRIGLGADDLKRILFPNWNTKKNTNNPNKISNPI